MCNRGVLRISIDYELYGKGFLHWKFNRTNKLVFTISIFNYKFFARFFAAFLLEQSIATEQ